VWQDPDDQRFVAKAVFGSVSLTGAVLLVLFGFLLPSHDYAGLGDPELASIVSDDARDFTAMLAIISVLLAGAAMVMIRFRGFVIMSTAVLMLGLFNLARLAPYY
jgi:hypothetical protein